LDLKQCNLFEFQHKGMHNLIYMNNETEAYMFLLIMRPTLVIMPLYNGTNYLVTICVSEIINRQKRQKGKHLNDLIF
jgi:hypothetical protein